MQDFERDSAHGATLRARSSEDEGDKQVPCEVYSRVVGYVRPVRHWNKGKKQEFTERQPYQIPRLPAPEGESAGIG